MEQKTGKATTPLKQFPTPEEPEHSTSTQTDIPSSSSPENSVYELEKLSNENRGAVRELISKFQNKTQTKSRTRNLYQADQIFLRNETNNQLEQNKDFDGNHVVRNCYSTSVQTGAHIDDSNHDKDFSVYGLEKLNKENRGTVRGLISKFENETQTKSRTRKLYQADQISLRTETNNQLEQNKDFDGNHVVQNCYSTSVQTGAPIDESNHDKDFSVYGLEKLNKENRGTVRELISEFQNETQAKSRTRNLYQADQISVRNENNNQLEQNKDFDGNHVIQNCYSTSVQTGASINDSNHDKNFSIYKFEKRNKENSGSVRELILKFQNGTQAKSRTYSIYQSDQTSLGNENNPAKRLRTYNKKRETKNVGREFEQVMCGYYALQLAINDDVKDFEMTSNNVDDGKFDDIGVKIKFTDGKVRRFLFQLKHRRKKRINIGDLKSPSKNNDFSVQIYINSISEMDVTEDTVYILATNSSASFKGNIPLLDGISIEQCKQPGFQDLLINTKDGQENAIFEIKSKNLKQHFYFFTSQMNLRGVEEQIHVMLKNLLERDIFDSFASFMRIWWSRKFILTKFDVLTKVSELALSPYLKTLTDEKYNEKSDSLKQAIMNFQLTIVEECGENIIENIWKNETSWIDEEFSKTQNKYGLMDDKINTTLWYLGKIPLVVKVDCSNEKIIKSILNFMRKGMLEKKIVLSGEVLNIDFEPWDTLQSLWDVIKRCQKDNHSLNIMQQFKVSLQGRKCITLENLVSSDAEVAKLIRIRELLQMSQQEYLLVGNQKDELPEFHIPRMVCPIFLKIADILKSCQSLRDTLLIVNCDETFGNKLSENKHVNTMELSEYLEVTSKQQASFILLATRSKCTNLQFETVCKSSNRSNVLLVQHHDDNYCILILRKGEKFEFKHTDSTKTAKEEEIFDYYKYFLHVFCASPGMGKSTLMKVLYNTCPSDCLAVCISLTNYNSFLREKPDVETIFACFLQIDVTEKDLFNQLKQFLFRQKRNLYMFLDGLDEVDGQNVELILNFVKHMSSQGVHIWMSLRENLRDKICHTLNTVPVDIRDLNKGEQEDYINCKLKQSYKNVEIEQIKSALFTSTHLNNSQNLLSIPLQLHIITEIFLDDRQVYENLNQQNFFVLTQLYRIYFEGKVKFTIDKFLDKNHSQQIGNMKLILQNYELPALKSCLDEEDCKTLQLNLEAADVKDFLHDLRNEGDKFGIIKAINDNDEAIFHHRTYAEYFACVWLKKNRNMTMLLRDKIFATKYENLRLIFDVMLAENNPLHLAIIYSDMRQFINYLEDIDRPDEGGRTVFHLGFSRGQNCRSFFVITDALATRRRELYEKMIKMLLKKSAVPQKKDDLFQLDCVSYALRSGCLYPIDRMLRKKLLTFEELKGPLYEYYDKKDLAYYSEKFGYLNLLSELIKTHGLISPSQLSSSLTMDPFLLSAPF